MKPVFFAFFMHAVLVAMNKPFDPYHRWLGIRPEEQPADHYRLLGLSRFEDDPEVIRDAAELRIRHVRSYQMGQHRKLTQKILNELAAARACLLDDAKRLEYEQRLRQAAEEKEKRAPPLPPPAPPAATKSNDAAPWRPEPGQIAKSAGTAIEPSARPASRNAASKRKTPRQWDRHAVRAFVDLRDVAASVLASAGQVVVGTMSRFGWPPPRPVLVGILGVLAVLSVIAMAFMLGLPDEPEFVQRPNVPPDPVVEVPEKPAAEHAEPKEEPAAPKPADGDAEEPMAFMLGPSHSPEPARRPHGPPDPVALSYTMREIAAGNPKLDMGRIEKVYGCRKLGRTGGVWHHPAISPDSWSFVLQDHGGIAEVWSLRSGEKTHSISGCRWFSSDGCAMASVNDKNFQVWNILDNEVTSTFEIDTEAVYATFSADNQFVFWHENKYDEEKEEKTDILHVWDAVANRETYVDSISGRLVRPPVLSGDGKTIAVWDQGGLRFVETESKRTIHRFARGDVSPPLMGASDGYFFLKDRDELSFFSTASRQAGPFLTGENLAVRSYRLLSNDRWIVVFLDNRRELRLYDVASRRLLGTAVSDSHISSFDVTKDGRTAVILSDGIVSLRSLNTGQVIRRLEGNENFAVDYIVVRLACDDTAVLCYGRKSLELISTSDGTPQLRKGGPQSTIYSIAYSPDGSLIASQCYSESRVNVWATRSGELLWSRFGEHGGGGDISRCVGGIQFSNDGKTLVATVGHAGFTAWNTTTAQSIHVASFKGRGGSWQACNDLAIAPGAKFIATCSRRSSYDKENEIDIWNLESNHETRSLARHTDTVRSVAFSPTEEILASGASDRKIKLWSTSDWREIDSFDATVSVLRFTPDGRHLASAHSGGVDLYDMKTREKAITLGPRAGSELAISGDSKWIASADSDRVYLWSVDATEPKLTLELKGCNGLALHPNGDTLATAWKNLIVEFDISDVTNANLCNTQRTATSADQTAASELACSSNSGIYLGPIEENSPVGSAR